MKNITLFAIVVFIISVGFIFIFSGGNTNVKIASQDNLDYTNKEDPTRTQVSKKAKNKVVYSTNNTSVKSKLSIKDTNKSNSSKEVQKHLVSPDVDIAKLEKSITATQNKYTMSISDIAIHSSLKDCYLGINGNVYDITSYIPYHPAGSRIMEKYCGKEVTNIFARIHSNRAWDLLRKYKVGTITTNKYYTEPDILSAIAKSLQEKNPQAIVMKVSPKKGMYIAKVIFNNKFYEVHIDKLGKIIREEIANDENWNTWEADVDDN